LERQTEDGNFNEVNTAHTGFALLALLDADVSGVETDKAVTWLKNAQLADGSWGRGLEGPGLTLYTGVVMTALSAAGVSSSDPAMTKAIAFCETSQNEDGGWAMVAGDSWSMTTSWLMQGLLSAGVSKDSDMIRNAHAFVLSCQNEDGGFGQVVTALSDPELTAYAVLGLPEIDGYSPELQNAAEYLRSVQEDDGSYISATPVEIEEPEKNLQITSFVVWAIHTLLVEKGSSIKGRVKRKNTCP
jgi:squalene cyclase